MVLTRNKCVRIYVAEVPRDQRPSSSNQVESMLDIVAAIDMTDARSECSVQKEPAVGS